MLCRMWMLSHASLIAEEKRQDCSPTVLTDLPDTTAAGMSNDTIAVDTSDSTSSICVDSKSPNNSSPLNTNQMLDNTNGRYSVDLLHAFPAVCQRAKNGVAFCHALAAFVQERTAIESHYARALYKIAHNAKTEDWAQQLSGCWTVVQMTIENIAQEHSTFATALQSSILPGAKAFATQQETQVQRLVAEGTKVRAAQQQIVSSMEKAKEKYDRKCTEAIELTTHLRKPDTNESSHIAAAPASNASTLSETSATTDDSSKELAEKLTAGAGQLLTKMWDTTSAFGRNALDRQRSKLDSCLEEVITTEKYYVQTVEYMNAQRPIYEREIKENLHAFQLTEEQRIDYLKDLLLRMQKAFIKMFEQSQQFVEQMKDCTNAINEFADIEQGFLKLREEEDVYIQESDLSNNTFYQRMLHIQSMSDKGHQTIRIITGVILDFIATEDQLMHSLRKLLRIHDNGGTNMSASDLFGISLSNLPNGFMSDEGETMVEGWKSTKDQIQLLVDVHREFRSLLSEPVALSLETMKEEYETACSSTQENFTRVHSALCHDSTMHLRLQQRLETKSREFGTLYQLLSTAVGESTGSTEHALEMLERRSASFSEKERRMETRLRQLANEMEELQQHVANSGASLKEKYDGYIQDIEIFISVYMKNEKYRLQVEKSSLQSFAKALEHLLEGGLLVASRALKQLEMINSSSDVASFIQNNRKPYERSRRVTPAYHTNDALKDALREYYRSRNISSGSSPTSVEKKMYRGVTSDGDRTSFLQQQSSDEEQSMMAGTTSFSAANTPDSHVKAINRENIPLDGDRSNENEGSTAGMGADDDNNESQSLAESDFQKKFKLDAPEQVVESYSCALFLSNFPYHGRLYLTRDHICFNGWRDTIYVASYLDISMIEKKNTALIVPNAIELTVNGDRVFFASFVFRDECFQCLQQLLAIKKGTEAILSEKSKHTVTDAVVEETSPAERESKPNKSESPTSIASVAPTPIMTGAASPEVVLAAMVANLNDSSSSLPVTVSSPADGPRIPERDTLLDEYEVVVDEVHPFSVDFVFSTLWVESNAFHRQLLESSGSTQINLPPWEKKSETYAAISKPDTFDAVRTVTFIHNKKYMVGPSTIPTTQLQRYKWDLSTRLTVSVTSTVADVPYCDYFRVEQRWVFSATKNPSACLAQVGIRVQWLKSTWLKKQIESTTVSEAKDAMKAWFNAAVETAKKKSSSDIAFPSTDVSLHTPSTSTFPEKSLSKASVTVVTTPSDVQDVSASSTHQVLSHTPALLGERTSPLKTIIQLANLLCVLLFIYMMYRICLALEQTQQLTREALLQQRQQQVFFKELFEGLQAHNRGAADEL